MDDKKVFTTSKYWTGVPCSNNLYLTTRISHPSFFFYFWYGFNKRQQHLFLTAKLKRFLVSLTLMSLFKKIQPWPLSGIMTSKFKKLSLMMNPRWIKSCLRLWIYIVYRRVLYVCVSCKRLHMHRDINHIIK